MKRSFSAIGVIILSVVAFQQMSIVAQEPLQWLYGKWELSYDPDKSPKDYIVFAEGGQLTSMAPGQADTQGTYTVTKERVIVMIPMGERVFSTFFTFDENKEHLYLKSPKTGNTAIYTKVKRK